MHDSILLTFPPLLFLNIISQFHRYCLVTNGPGDNSPIGLPLISLCFWALLQLNIKQVTLVRINYIADLMKYVITDNHPP